VPRPGPLGTGLIIAVLVDGTRKKSTWVFSAAGHKAAVGDVIIVAAYGYVDDAEIESFAPKIVLVGEGNRIAGVK
jgi:aspartate 1-decarboxylase